MGAKCDRCCQRGINTIILDSGGILTLCNHHTEACFGAGKDPGVDFTIIHGAVADSAKVN